MRIISIHRHFAKLCKQPNRARSRIWRRFPIEILMPNWRKWNEQKIAYEAKFEIILARVVWLSWIVIQFLELLFAHPNQHDWSCESGRRTATKVLHLVVGVKFESLVDTVSWAISKPNRPAPFGASNIEFNENPFQMNSLKHIFYADHSTPCPSPISFTRPFANTNTSNTEPREETQRKKKSKKQQHKRICCTNTM